MKKTVTINKKEMNVSFSGYYDSSIGDLLFTQVMCDVFMPGNEVVPIAVEKEQIRRIVEAFKKRKALYDEVRKEVVKGKPCYVINPRMRYDLGWLEGKKILKLSKDEPPREVPADPSVSLETEAPKEPPKRQEPADDRRKYLAAKGFRYNESTRNWEAGSIRFPDNLIGKAATDEEFKQGMDRLMEADERDNRKRKPPKRT